jgi:hypothetical protein
VSPLRVGKVRERLSHKHRAMQEHLLPEDWAAAS